MDRLEILIDNLLIYMPADIPFLVSLMQRQEGRYIVLGLGVVIVLLVFWTFLKVLQMMFFGHTTEKSTDKTPPIELSEQEDTAMALETEPEPAADGFSFFKKTHDSKDGDLSEDPALVAIEQEMLAVRRLYTDGQILRDVYVSETRRLYAMAQNITSGQSG
jgi:hypothetical protein